MLDTPFMLSAQILPPWASTIALQMANPRPVPSILPSLPEGTVENLSKMVFKFSGGIPLPWSLTDTVIISFKPFNFLELSARIKSIFKRVERSLVKNQDEFKDLSINFKARSISVRDESVKLTKTEFELLELFVSYPDEVLSREFIQQQIWQDSQLYHTSRAVDVHVQRLRKKIEPEIEKPEYYYSCGGRV